MSITKEDRLLRRKYIIRKKVFGFPDKPRVSVYRSLKHIYAQAIDDTVGKTIAAASTLLKELQSELKGKTKTEQGKIVGELLGKKLLKLNIDKIVFDRSGRKYHGRIKAVADGIRLAGVKF